MKLNEAPCDMGNSPIALTKWQSSIGVSSTTIWRWRKRGWLKVLNIAGKLYITPTAVTEFGNRAEAGEFSKSSPLQKLVGGVQ